ncbi:hypothetical protein P4O66_006060 [Electrophorus voltai]|uniref:Uncharacterized protein n=1 Tax=Electrophorus voltai TaxID=2609070 RepID=A0AAD9E0L8_9TELE|nr:hypothetical protein P4O66_006060 [Electrophorus voltai]
MWHQTQGLMTDHECQRELWADRVRHTQEGLHQRDTFEWKPFPTQNFLFIYVIAVGGGAGGYTSVRMSVSTTVPGHMQRGWEFSGKRSTVLWNTSLGEFSTAAAMKHILTIITMALTYFSNQGKGR